VAAKPLTNSLPAEPFGSAGLPALNQATAASAAVAVSGSIADSTPVEVAPAATPSPSAPPSGEALDAVQLDASKLHVYQVALELHAFCSTLVGSLQRIVRDQLERASLSVILNTAEAGGRRSRREKARFYAIARGSATEVAALLDVLVVRRLASPEIVRSGRRLATRVVQMLSRMDQRLLS
jgi:four helix bundle protein